MTKGKGIKWDGKSRVSNNLYRKRYNEIFKKMTKEKAIDETVPLNEDPFKKEYDELDESYKQSKKNKKEREKELKEIDDRNGF